MKNIRFFLIILNVCFASSILISQEINSLSLNEDDRVYKKVDKEPQFPGGEEALHQYFYDNIFIPYIYSGCGDEKMILRFIVEKDGSLSEIETSFRNVGPTEIKILSMFHYLTREVKILMPTMPKWIPGSISGDAVRTKFKYILKFTKEEVASIIFEKAICENVDEPPEFPGGDKLCQKYIMDNLKLKDSLILANNPYINILLKFIVERDGSLTDVSISHSSNKQLNDEILRIFKSMPKWEAGKIGGTPVRVMDSYSVVLLTGIESEDEIFLDVETMPRFPGGEIALQRFLAHNINYPIEARENGIQGRVDLTFIIEKNGVITDIRVLKSPGDALSKEAIRIVKLMPPWVPGTQRGKPVRVQFNLPIRFVLQ